MSDPKPKSSLQDPDMVGVYPALVRAGQRARELGLKMGAPVYVLRDGKIVDLTSETLAAAKSDETKR